MRAPTLFGFPLYVGLKHRVAKKHLRRWWTNGRKQDLAEFKKWLKQFDGMGIGSIISECSGLNSRITKLDPRYLPVGNGKILINIDFTTETNGCSLAGCGVAKPKTKEECEAYRQYIISRPDAKDWNFDLRYSPEVMTIHDDGTHTTDYARLAELEKQRKEQSSASTY